MLAFWLGKIFSYSQSCHIGYGLRDIRNTNLSKWMHAFLYNKSFKCITNVYKLLYNKKLAVSSTNLQASFEHIWGASLQVCWVIIYHTCACTILSLSIFEVLQHANVVVHWLLSSVLLIHLCQNHCLLVHWLQKLFLYYNTQDDFWNIIICIGLLFKIKPVILFSPLILMNRKYIRNGKLKNLHSACVVKSLINY